MDLYTPSTIAWLVAVVGLLLFEAVAIWRGWKTLSQVVWKYAPLHPLIPFLVGILCGHFFWRT